MFPQGLEWLLYLKEIGFKGLIYYHTMQCYVHKGVLIVLFIGSAMVLSNFHKGGCGRDYGSSRVKCFYKFALIQW